MSQDPLAQAFSAIYLEKVANIPKSTFFNALSGGRLRALKTAEEAAAQKVRDLDAAAGVDRSGMTTWQRFKDWMTRDSRRRSADRALRSAEKERMKEQDYVSNTRRTTALTGGAGALGVGGFLALRNRAKKQQELGAQ